jgi:hypothetical protein
MNDIIIEQPVDLKYIKDTNLRNVVNIFQVKYRV